MILNFFSLYPFKSCVQAKKEKRDLEMSERMSNATTVDVIPELYEKIRVPGDNILKSKLVEVKLYKVGKEHKKKLKIFVSGWKW